MAQKYREMLGHADSFTDLVVYQKTKMGRARDLFRLTGLSASGDVCSD